MTIQEIKQRLSITVVLNHYGIQIQRGKQIHCPFHEDKTPSMQVYEDKGLVYCHSSNCKNGGKHLDQIEIIQQKEGCNKHEAIKKAISLITGNIVKPTLKMIEAQMEYEDLFIKLQQCYARNDKAIAYAKSRNINNGKLQIGYNTATGTVFKSLKNCIIFPLKDSAGNIVSLYGRSIDNNSLSRDNGNKAKHYYTANRKGLYHNATAETKTLILTESIIDSATLQVFTDYETLAMFGTNGFNQEHETLLKSLTNLEEIIFFLDGDEAGRRAITNYELKITNLLPNVKLSKVTTLDDEDINSLTISHAPEILNHLIESRIQLFSSSLNKFGTGFEKTQQLETSIPIAIGTTNKLDTSNEEYLAYQYENIIMSIIGGIATYPIDKLKVTLGLQRTDSKNKLHRLRHNFDLYNEEALQRFIRNASEKLDIGSKPLQYGIAELIELLENHRNDKINRDKPKVEPKKVLNAFRIDELYKIAKRVDLIAYLNTLIGGTGIVGEEINRLIMWIVFTSRFMENPLHIICLGASGTGKTYLQEKVAELFPKEEKISFTASTEQAFYYVGRTELKHKIVLVEDMDGASGVLYVLRELQTKAYVSKLVPIKDSKGNMQTKMLEVEGPIVLSGTTTKEKLYEDNANRCLLIYLDNSSTQQAGIMNRQRNVSAGLVNRAEEERVIELLQDLQRIFRPIKVVNPFATKLHIPETVFKPLRTNAHYLQFIEAITFIHQHQRVIKKDAQGNDYIETTISDIEIANDLLKDILLSKSDELTKACRDFLETVRGLIKEHDQESFYKSDVRAWLGINPSNLKHYLKTLHFYGYIQIVGGNKHKGYEYEIVNKDEYEDLQNTVQTALDNALEQIRKSKGVDNG